MVASGVRHQHFQSTSPLKPLGQFQLNFIFSLQAKGERKCIYSVQVTSPRWPPCPYIVKTLKNLLQNHCADCLETWYVASGELEFYIKDDTQLTLTYLMPN